MGKTSIEWTDVSWNCVRGCSRVSEGCRNCYAERMAARFSDVMWSPNFRARDRKLVDAPFKGFAEETPNGPRWTGKVELIESKLEEPLHWRKPRRIFVNSMSDLLHEELHDESILKVIDVMAMTPRHTYQILTKREERMYHLMNYIAEAHEEFGIAQWPLPNVHLGVSVENQATKERMDWLRKTPAAARFVSLEPCLEDPGELNLEGIHQIIFGGESGPGARPCDLAWARSARDQCQSAGVSFFMKQAGSNPITHLNPYAEAELNAFGGREFGRPEPLALKSRKGGKLEELPADLRIRQHVGECNG